VVSQPLFVAAVVVAAEHLDVFVRRLSVVPVFAAAGHVAVQHSGALAVAVAADAAGLPAVVAVVAFAARDSAARRAGDHWWPVGCPLDDSHSDCSRSDYLESPSADDWGSADSDSPHSACSDWHWADWHLADSQPADLHQVDLDSLRSADCRLVHSDSHSADLEQADSHWHSAHSDLVDSGSADSDFRRSACSDSR